eukprot:gene10082-biopygen210
MGPFASERGYTRRCGAFFKPLLSGLGRAGAVSGRPGQARPGLAGRAGRAVPARAGSGRAGPGRAGPGLGRVWEVGPGRLGRAGPGRSGRPRLGAESAETGCRISNADSAPSFATC